MAKQQMTEKHVASQSGEEEGVRNTLQIQECLRRLNMDYAKVNPVPVTF